MSENAVDIRTVTLVDIPLVLRLTEKNILLDCEASTTGDTNGSISSLILPGRGGVHTLIARSDKQSVAGQFRMRSADAHAQIVYMAPALEVDGDDTTWLHMLDAMTREAGKHGAHALLAEIEETAPLFETLRTAGFAVYARQEVWKREAGNYSFTQPVRHLTQATDDDEGGIWSLLASIVPGLVQPFALPDTDMPSLIYRVDDRVEAYFAFSEGKNGIYVMPYLHPDILPDATAVIESALRLIPRAGKLPVYFCVRRYQDWMISALEDLQFDRTMRQALMVRHIAAGVRHPEFAPLPLQLENATHTIKPNPYTDTSVLTA
jgi:hypothetical protein